MSTTSDYLRHDGRLANQLRDVTITRGWSSQAEGSALIDFGGTRVLCTASFESDVPRWLRGRGPAGSPLSTRCCRGPPIPETRANP